MSQDPALDKMNLFLHHAQTGDLDDAGLYTLKAEAFEEIARRSAEQGDDRLAAEATEAAIRARRVAADVAVGVD